MTRGSGKEYAEAIRERYRRASRKEKRWMLEEFTQVTGYHLLRRERSRVWGRRRGRPRQYGTEVAVALKVVWEATAVRARKVSISPP